MDKLQQFLHHDLAKDERDSRQFLNLHQQPANIAVINNEPLRHNHYDDEIQ